jgi:uncharacterized protein (DUF2147 family)
MIHLFALAAIAAIAADTAPENIQGRWSNPDHTVVVDIAPCSGGLCGTVVWATAQAQQDARRGTPQLIGTPILTELQPGDGVWKGKLFVPDADIRAEGKLEPMGADQLKVEGCEFGICKSQLWSKAEGPLPPAQ